MIGELARELPLAMEVVLADCVETLAALVALGVPNVDTAPVGAP